ncbi:hypothetical protein LKI01_10280 [Companilactobacillus paralimentarius]|nr:hypothetical protein LKI01_10280 [Companilactobacillus paralimentarius]
MATAAWVVFIEKFNIKKRPNKMNPTYKTSNFLISITPFTNGIANINNYIYIIVLKR